MSTLSTSEDRLQEIRFIVETIILADKYNFNGLGTIELVRPEERNRCIYDFATFDANSFPYQPSNFSNFTRSSFEKAIFVGTSLDVLSFDSCNFAMCNLSQVQAEYILFDKSYFTLSKIISAIFTNCSFKNTNFRNCDLRFSKFDTCDFENLLNLETCDCRGTNFTDCVNFPYENKTEFIIALNNYGGKADENTLWIDGTSLLT